MARLTRILLSEKGLVLLINYIFLSFGLNTFSASVIVFFSLFFFRFLFHD